MELPQDSDVRVGDDDLRLLATIWAADDLGRSSTLASGASRHTIERKLRLCGSGTRPLSPC